MALSLSEDPVAPAQQLGNPYAPPTVGGIVQNGRHTVGTRAVDRFGNTYRYAYNGAVALVAGNWIQSAAQITAHQDLTPVAASIGDTTITVALGATAATANQYAGGWAVISTTPGNGIKYLIDSHPAAALSTSVVITLAQPIEVALTTSSRVDLVPNPYNGVIQTPVTTLTGVVVGVATGATPINNYDWIQTGGVAAALIAGTPGVGLAVVCPGTAAGACVIDGAASATPIVGMMVETGVDGKNKAVKLSLGA